MAQTDQDKSSTARQNDAQVNDQDRNDPDQTAMREIKVTTTEPIGKSSSPRQPNDRDESPDSQAIGTGDRANIRQAAADVASGQVDTDRWAQPGKNPENRTPATDSPRSSQKLPDGRQK